MKTAIETKLVTKKLQDELSDWKDFGAVTTPPEIVHLMIRLSGIKKWKNLSILEPACGYCNFIGTIHEKYPSNNLTGIEFNDRAFSHIKQAYRKLPFELINNDFLLYESPKRYDLVIGNPPYGIIGNDSHYAIGATKETKDEYKRLFATWYGKYNIYGAFIEKSISVLAPNGRLVFVVPATWMVLDDFKKLRKFLSQTGRLQLYYLGGKVFKGMAVSTCIMVFEKNGTGLEVYEKKAEDFKLSFTKKNWQGEMITFENKQTRNLEKDKTLLTDIFDIKISARSPEVDKFSKLQKKQSKDSMNFINGRNVKKGFIDRTNYFDFWVKKNDVTKLKSFYGILPRIVVGHTKGGKIVAALEDKLHPYIGDVYHLLPKVKLTKPQLQQITDWLNSDEIDEYVTSLYKDITPHTTATQLRKIPIKINLNTGHLF